MRDKVFNIAKSPNYDAYQRGLASMVYNCFDKKFVSLPDKSVSSSGVANNDIKQNLQLAKELRKPVIRKLKKVKLILDLKIIFGKAI